MELAITKKAAVHNNLAIKGCCANDPYSAIAAMPTT
jgi:hypothetical protein